MAGYEATATRGGAAQQLRKPALLHIFLWMVLFLLVGYAFGGRGFAYLGYPPIFVGEIGFVLALGVVTWFWQRIPWGHPLICLLILFMAWGAVRTLPFLTYYGIDALRDAAQWGYALFAVAVAATVLRGGNRIEAGVEAYGSVLRYFLPWLVIATVMWRFLGVELPRWPWGPAGGLEIIRLKYGDVGVHLAGAAAFMTLGLGRAPLKGAIWWVLWFTTFAAVAAINRGGMVAVVFVLVMLIVLQPFGRWYRFASIAVVGLSLLIASGVELDTGGARKLSAEGLWLNVSSMLNHNERVEARTGTMEWRFEWWQTIVNYTLHGPYYWGGKGFGINLADADGFQVTADAALRSPHNSHLTLLARGGVPALALWMLLQGAFAVYMLRAYIADRLAGRIALANVELWVLLYWSAFMINGMFDVFLEGPQGAIWFWSLFGYGLALLITRQRMLRHMRRLGPPRRRAAS